ncbi:receptor-like protein kinase FERONIA isoform X2 [Lactuca sativa]|uniref:receptor-like protein kinase FERONIA isoform X2 n=1 Tax=Lactuca sativa TaxID=4236 RepID=UPI001C6938AD|nr:receptor-like protein kinase FERONIA isoform X2 [Lactuca sativa]
MDALKEFQHLKIVLNDIRSATANFHVWKVIGEGGFGKVYKALLSYSEGRNQVACKRLDPDRTHGQGDAEFWKEILLLSRYKHKNLISLLGFCSEEGERILVYELASHGSLDKHLSSSTLSWRQRFNICLTAAKGLCYLHDPNGTQQRVIHRDIKSNNILLFEELSTSHHESWHAKIGDLGLSKLGPANQSHSFAPTNAVGTDGYIDPTFENTATLTKESDVYSFGVVLFEVFCGKLCGDYSSGRFENLVPKWKLSCKEVKSDDIIFRELKYDIDPSSMKTFLDIAYRCLEESRENRPKMSEVVEELDIALRLQEIYDEGEPPIDYEEISKTATPCLVYKSEEELKMLLSKGVFLNSGKTWFLLNADGEHCEMISSQGCLIPIEYLSSVYGKKSRFAVDYRYGAYFCDESKMHLRAQFLSPHVTYTINLVFDFYDTTLDNLGIHYKLAGEKKSFTSYLVDEGEDGWLISELFQFTSHRRQLDLEITFECKNAIVVDAIEFRPLERVEHQLLENEEVDMPETYWEQKLPSDYEDIIKWSKYNVQQATKKELYSILCQGFLINNGEEQKMERNAICYQQAWLCKNMSGDGGFHLMIQDLEKWLLILMLANFG